jgi:hypothetical protein
MLKTFFISLIFAVTVTSCDQKKVTSEARKKSEPGSFFPVTEYLKGQIKELDDLPVTPLKIVIINGKRDSVWLKRNEVSAFVQPFLNPIIDSVHWSTYFTEKSFLDQTINAFTFTYDPVKPLPDSIELKHWDVYVDPASNKVKRIYIVKQLNTTPPQTKQLIWEQAGYCKITTIIEQENVAPRIKEEQLIWNFNDN